MQNKDRGRMSERLKWVAGAKIFHVYIDVFCANHILDLKSIEVVFKCRSISPGEGDGRMEEGEKRSTWRNVNCFTANSWEYIRIVLVLYCIPIVLYCIVFVSLLRNAKFSAANSSPALMAILSIAEIHIQNTLDTNGDESFSKTAASGRNI